MNKEQEEGGGGGNQGEREGYAWGKPDTRISERQKERKVKTLRQKVDKLVKLEELSRKEPKLD